MSNLVGRMKIVLEVPLAMLGMSVHMDAAPIAEMECSMTGMALATTEHKGMTTDAVMETTSVGVLGAMDAMQGLIDVLI